MVCRLGAVAATLVFLVEAPATHQTSLTASSFETRATAEAANRCPLPGWRGQCRRMTFAEMQRVAGVVRAYTLDTVTECGPARGAIADWLSDRREAWVFEKHASDDRQRGNYILAETAWFDATQAPAGVGFRSTILLSDPLTIARVAIHEGVHLNGGGEEAARRVENRCLLPLS